MQKKFIPEVILLAIVSLGTIAVVPAAMAHSPRGICQLAEDTASNQRVGFYPNWPQAGSKWVSLRSALAAIRAGCGGVFSHGFHNLQTGLWTPIAKVTTLPPGTTNLWVGSDHLIMVPESGRR